MSNLIDYYEYSKLATAAYLDLTSLNGTEIANESNAKERLPGLLAKQTFDQTSEQAQASGAPVWTVSPGGYYGNDSEGFAATLFSRAGEKVLAIRGTEPDMSPSGDLLKADLGQIGFFGIALGQALSMVNYIHRLQAGTNTNVQQLTWVYSKKPPAGQSISIGAGKGYIYLTAMKSEKGLGLLAPGEKINVTGHSLGGHLAALAARLFPQLISESYTFNAPGFDPSTANGVVGVVSSLLSPVLGAVINTTGGAALQLTDEFVGLMGNYLSPPPASSFAQTIIHNLESEDIAPGNDGSGVASVLTGTHNLPQEILIPTERNSHMIEPFMDSLSMQALLSRLKPDITTAQIESLFRAVSISDGDVLEKLVTSLRDSLIGKGVPLDRISDTVPIDFGHSFVHLTPFALKTVNVVHLECSVLSANDYAWALLA